MPGLVLVFEKLILSTGTNGPLQIDHHSLLISIYPVTADSLVLITLPLPYVLESE
jgi:hypothetical protein